jgi:hypothetical protein
MPGISIQSHSDVKVFKYSTKGSKNRHTSGNTLVLPSLGFGFLSSRRDGSVQVAAGKDISLPGFTHFRSYVLQ